MASIIKDIAKKLLPVPVRLAIARRIGRTNWYRQGNGITFKEAGFVAASSPRSLLARHNYESQVIRHLLEDLSGANALEIGCGYGRLSPVIAEKTKSLISVDHNPNIISIAQNTYPELEFAVSSVVEMPFNDDSFDVVISWTVLQHVPPKQIDTAIREIQRVLRPDGKVILCEETRLSGAPIHSQTHTWHREINEYRRMFTPFELAFESDIEPLSRLPEVGAPGRLMVFNVPKGH